jgi:regulator of protease activity HflC (stomatin/prohibitin superfamily)
MNLFFTDVVSLVSVCALPILVLVLFTGIRVAQEYQRAVVFRLGRFAGIKGPGIYWLIPIVDRQTLVDIRTNTVAVESQETITRDSVTIKVDAVLWYRVIDAEKAIIQVASYPSAVHQVAATTLRNIIGQHALDEVLNKRDAINSAIRVIVDEATETWGVKIEMVELRDIEIPEAMQRAMAREAEALREKRARLIKAEAELEASEKLSQGAEVITRNPVALELRRMQMIAEVGAEQNTTTIIMMPSEFVTMAKSIADSLSAGKK